MPGAIMMCSMFALFVIEMWLTSKIGGHSHGGPTGGQIQHNAPHHHQHREPGRPGTPDSDKTLHIGGDRAYDDEKMPSRFKAAEESRMEQNFLQVSSVAEQPMPAWFVVFYEQYIRQRMEMMELINSDSSRAKAEQDLKGVSHVHVRETFDEEGQTVDPMVLKKMNLNISLLEGGILFHSIFVGITISITSEGFIVLLVAILFHQMFEGIGLGSRIAAVPYPKKSIRPWVLVCAFGLTCPIGQAIGLLSRNSYDPDSAYGLIMVGVFNAM
jgi:zinc transporter ZupT